MERGYRMCTDNATTHVTAAVPWQTRVTDHNAICKSDRLWESNGT